MTRNDIEFQIHLLKALADALIDHLDYGSGEATYGVAHVIQEKLTMLAKESGHA